MRKKIYLKGEYMVKVFTRLPVKSEFFEEYAKHLSDVMDRFDIQNVKGCLGMDILYPKSIPQIGENSNFIIETRWDDMESFLSFTKSDQFQKSHINSSTKDWFLSRPSVEVYESVG